MHGTKLKHFPFGKYRRKAKLLMLTVIHNVNKETQPLPNLIRNGFFKYLEINLNTTQKSMNLKVLLVWCIKLH